VAAVIEHCGGVEAIQALLSQKIKRKKQCFREKNIHKKCDLSLTTKMGFGRVWLRRREEMRPFLDMEREGEREREAFLELEIRGERERESWAVCRTDSAESSWAFFSFRFRH